MVPLSLGMHQSSWMLVGIVPGGPASGLQMMRTMCCHLTRYRDTAPVEEPPTLAKRHDQAMLGENRYCLRKIITRVYSSRRSNGAQGDRNNSL
jgi:hypothetical protein